MTDVPTIQTDDTPPAPPPPPKAAKKAMSAPKQARGIHVVFDKENTAVAAYSGEIDSLRHAMRIGGSARHVAFGESFAAK
jgi:hypothetical protein